MKIKVASTGHDMTYRVDRTGSTPRYWITYDTVTQSFEVSRNARNDEANNESFTPSEQSLSDMHHPFSGARRDDRRPPMIESVRPLAPQMTVAEAIAAYLDSKGDETTVDLSFRTATCPEDACAS